MRGNFNLNHEVTVWDYAEFIGNFNKNNSERQKVFLTILLNYLKMDEENIDFEYMVTSRGHGGRGSVVFFEDYLMEVYSDYSDYLGLAIQNWFQDDYIKIVYGKGHIYCGNMIKYFSSNSCVEVTIDKEIYENLLNGELTKEQEKEFLSVMEELKNKVQKWNEDNLN